jgi:hypothetical protein
LLRKEEGRINKNADLAASALKELTPQGRRNVRTMRIQSKELGSGHVLAGMGHLKRPEVFDVFADKSGDRPSMAWVRNTAGYPAADRLRIDSHTGRDRIYCQ